MCGGGCTAAAWAVGTGHTLFSMCSTVDCSGRVEERSRPTKLTVRLSSLLLPLLPSSSPRIPLTTSFDHTTLQPLHSIASLQRTPSSVPLPADFTVPRDSVLRDPSTAALRCCHSATPMSSISSPAQLEVPHSMKADAVHR